MSAEDRIVSLVDLMDQLIEPPVPEPVPLTPQTAGWWVVGALTLAALGYALRRVWLHRRANAYRRAALADLSRAEAPAEIAAVLRRAALAAFPRREVASLSGPDWTAFLRRTGPFPDAAGEALSRAPYVPGGTAPGLREAASAWIRRHRRPS